MASASSVFQLHFYGLMLWRERDVVPRRLQLVYLGAGQVRHQDPVAADLEQTERDVRARWDRITRAGRTGEFRTRRSALCGWCAHQALCPEFGGRPPELVLVLVELALGVRPD